MTALLDALPDVKPPTRKEPVLAAVPDLRLLNRREAAALIGTSEKTLKRWEAVGKGPPVLRFGKRMARYTVLGLREWLKVVTEDAVHGEEI